MRYPTITPARLLPLIPALHTVAPALLARVAVDAVYAPHLRRQAQDMRAFMADERLVLDPQVDYAAAGELSAEVRERLARVRPTTIVSVPDLSVLSCGLEGELWLTYLRCRARQNGWRV